jgi:hypothetical protein
MPLYRLKDTKNNTEFDIVCSWDELQTMLNEQPELKQMLSTPKIVSGTGSVLRKTDDGWKENLKRIKDGSGSSNTIKL